jgi:exonuclease III
VFGQTSSLKSTFNYHAQPAKSSSPSTPRTVHTLTYPCLWITTLFLYWGFIAPLLVINLPSMRILTLNVKGLRDPVKRTTLFHWLAALTPSPHIIALQETHCTSKEELEGWLTRTGYTGAGSYLTSRAGGVVILCRPSVTLLSVVCTIAGRFLSLKVRHETKDLVVSCVYAPSHNPERNDFFEAILALLDPTADNLMMGDFNSVLAPAIDRRSPHSSPGRLYDSVAILARLLSDCRLMDIWRYLHPRQVSYTFYKPDGQSASRIDLIFCHFATYLK